MSSGSIYGGKKLWVLRSLLMDGRTFEKQKHLRFLGARWKEVKELWK